MKNRIYIETTIVSYLTARPSRDLIFAARQELTSEWWREQRADFDAFTSQLVWDEAVQGDPDAARRRVQCLEELPLLDIPEQAAGLARMLFERHALPAEAEDDALHIATAAIHEMDFLLTWNCRHIANAVMMPIIRDTIASCGYDPPMICTPEDLLEAYHA